jgi:hypothetical protein
LGRFMERSYIFGFVLRSRYFFQFFSILDAQIPVKV